MKAAITDFESFNRDGRMYYRFKVNDRGVFHEGNELEVGGEYEFEAPALAIQYHGAGCLYSV